MCRIAGIASIVPFPNREESLKSMMGAIAHGGPDDAGCYQDDKVALGHRRLAIIDLSYTGPQPMLLGKEFIITYQGEKYNYLSLKAEPESLGRTFKTKTDTEVNLHGYRKRGGAGFN